MIKNTICFCGENGSGKDYLTDYICQKYNYKRLSFSDELKRYSDFIFPWLPSFDILPEQKDKPFNHIKNDNNLTPRQIWSKVNDIVRGVNKSAFLDSFIINQWDERYYLINEYNYPYDGYIITDLRTPEEYQWIISEDIPIIRIYKNCHDNYPINEFEKFIGTIDRNSNGVIDIFFNKKDGLEEFNEFIEKYII